MAENVKGEMIRGQIDTVILLALVDGDKDSNEIRTAIETKSDNKYCVKQGTFYSAMQRLVEKGYIKEYRSSAVDGIRRKYYSLNPKGKKFLDKNIEQWTASKALVDNLMDTETPMPVEEKPQFVETPADEFEEFKALTTESIGDFSVAEPVEDNLYFDKLGNDVLSDLNSELEKLSVQEDTKNVEEELPTVETVEDEKVSKIEENNEDFIDIYENIENGESSESYEFEELDETEEFSEEIIEETSDEINDDYEEFVDYDKPQEDTQEELVESEETTHETSFNEPINFEESNSEVYTESLENEENSFVEEETQSNVSYVETKEEIYSDEVEVIKEDTQYVEEVENAKDDMLVVKDSVPTNSHEYRRILGRLYPKADEPKPTVKTETENKANDEIEEPSTTQETIVRYEYVTKGSEPKKEEEIEEVIVSEPKRVTSPTVIEEKQPVSQKTVCSEPTDFSDIYNKARREGFKVKTSYNTNSFSGSEILISKLRLHSSILLYLFLLIQCVLLDFSLSSILNMQLNTKLIILGCLASFPIFCLLIHLFNRKRTVYDVIPFKDAISAALIITFQLTIIILCVALFVNVDFNNFKEVSTFIVLPFVLVLNIPLYFIFKYTLLSTGRYFTED